MRDCLRFKRTAIRDKHEGTTSLRISSRLVIKSPWKSDSPVRFPLGLARLRNQPGPNRIGNDHDDGYRTGKPSWRYGLPAVLAARMTPTFRRTSSAASSGSSIIPSGSKAPLYDDVLTFEITQPLVALLETHPAKLFRSSAEPPPR